MRAAGVRIVRLLAGSALAAVLLATLVFVWRTPAARTDVVASVVAFWGAATAPWIIALTVLAALEWRLVAALTRARVPAVPGRRTAEGGTAVVEFAMLFPIAVMVLMIMVQLSLLMQGNVVINYAAYAAARSAVVQIPQDYVGEGRNELAVGPAGWKMDRIRRAAVLALTPIGGRVPAEDEGLAIQADLRLLYDQAGEQPRAGLGQAFAEKFTYCNERTRILEVGPPAGNDRFEPLQAVRVVVEHDLVLSVPFARAIFADGSFQDADGATHYYTTVETHYQLTNEGPRAEPLEPYCPQPPPPPPPPWTPPDTGCPYH